MNKLELQTFLSDKIRYLDGATGSNLMKAGMPIGVCPEKWILDNKDICLSLQKEYVAAGSEILYCPTFTANRIKLEEYGLYDRMEEMITELVGISKEAAAGSDHPVYIAGDLTMTGRQLAPIGTMDFEELVDVYKEQIRYLENAGVDMLIVETMMSLQETRAALIAAKEASNLAVMVTLTFEKDGRTLFGTDAGTAAIVLEKLGAAAIGANCSTGPEGMSAIIRTMADSVSIPIIAKPNAGLPAVDENGNTFYNMGPEQFGREMVQLVESGAGVLGGCCGTTPEHISQLRLQTEGMTCTQRQPSDRRYLTSERQTVAFDLDGQFIIVGERINPTGKKALQAELREGNFDMVVRFAEEQEECGAQILDINMGMNGIDEKKMMLQAITEVSNVTNLPLSLDSSHIDVLEEALRRYPGRALINSISLEQEKFDKLLPLAAKYGAMFILLPLSDKGLPENLTEKKEIIHTILERAYSLGLTNNDIIVDGLVTTVGANKQAALEALETIRYCHDMGLATICGLSNISFGMPQRSYVNAAFLTMAIRAGLTMAIANPSQELLVSCALATDLLLAKDGADIRYIEYTNTLTEKKEAAPAVSKSAESTPKPMKASNEESSLTKDPLFEAVVKGNQNGIEKITRDALEEGRQPSVLLNEILLPAINQVGEYFDKGKFFLPQLIAGAEAMKKAIEILEPLLLTEDSEEEKVTVILATVEGDIHDIGKNLVGLMLKNYGFRVVDLGKDVPSEAIVTAAREENAQLIGLSALMTTTMQKMKEVVCFVKKEKLPVKVMIGGAVITPEYAAEIGADGYAQDAADAVKVAKRLAKLPM